MAGIILIVLGVIVILGCFLRKPEAEPQEKITSTGVVEQVHGGEGCVQYTVRFTGARNRSFLAKTGFYCGKTDKYEDGKLVHIRYWFDRKGRPGVELLDDSLTEAPGKTRSTAWWGLILSLLLLLLGIVLLVL